MPYPENSAQTRACDVPPTCVCPLNLDHDYKSTLNPEPNPAGIGTRLAAAYRTAFGNAPVSLLLGLGRVRDKVRHRVRVTVRVNAGDENRTRLRV